MESSKCLVKKLLDVLLYVVLHWKKKERKCCGSAHAVGAQPTKKCYNQDKELFGPKVTPRLSDV